MKEKLVAWLKCPLCDSPFECKEPQAAADGEIEGGRLECSQGHAFPILAGVPTLLPASELAGQQGRGKTHAAEISESFSAEWSEFDPEQRTWHETVEDRRKLFLKEVGCSAEDLAGKVVFDAGCGNGSHSDGISRLGCDVVAVDVSESVYSAARYYRKHGTGCTHFVRGDLSNVPLKAGSMDVVYSSGVLHHNPDTLAALKSVAATLAAPGRIYIWLYHKEPGLKFWLQLKLRAFLGMFPMPVRKAFVKMWCVQSMARQSLRTLFRMNDEKDRLTWNERLIDLYDIYTPAYRWMHTQDEVRGWYRDLGLDGIETTEVRDWGFGMLALKPVQKPAETVSSDDTAVDSEA